MEIKNWYKSKTLWINALVIAGGVITLITNELIAGGVITGIGILNMILRVITNTKLQ